MTVEEARRREQNINHRKQQLLQQLGAQRQLAESAQENLTRARAAYVEAGLDPENLDGEEQRLTQAHAQSLADLEQKILEAEQLVSGVQA